MNGSVMKIWLRLFWNTDDGPDPNTNYSILNRGKRHDYFTSCLPWTQKGPSVAMPLGSSADVKWRNAPGNTPTMRYTAGGIAPAGALSALVGGGNQSVSAHSFAMVPRADIPRSRFTVQTSHKTTFDAGKLIPIYVDEVLPGDTSPTIS